MSRASTLAKAIGADGAIAVSGNTTLGDASTDTVTFNAATASIPNNINFSGGNLGVGIASPSARVHANVNSAGATVYPLYVSNNANSTTEIAGLAFTDGSNVKSSIRAAVYGTDYMAFSVGSNTERMRIDASGNLQIWNGSISNSAGGKTFTMYGSSTTAAAKISLTQIWNGIAYPSNIIALSDPTAGGASSALSFQTSVWNGSSVTTSEAMRIDYSQSIGVGTSTPSAKFHVNGGAIRTDLNGSGTSAIFTGTGSNFQISHNSSNYVKLYNSGGAILLQSNNSSTSGVVQQPSNPPNKGIRWVITNGDSGTNTAQTYWNIAYGSAQAGGCLGAYDRSGNYASPSTTISGSDQWSIYGFVSYTV